jgi:coenzyme F420-0:L-glutamate ligase/coenzyme F420-1:gamma-L-glutamate ligase
MAERLEIIPVEGIGEVTPGADLAAIIATAAPWLRDGDVLVVTSKVVSKAEGRLADVPVDGPERDDAREALLAAETARTVARRGPTHIVQTHHGFVLAAGGIDASNVEPSRLVLLPKDPDASARGLRSALRDRYGLDVAVVVSDTMGRPWRNGLTDVALGAAGIEPVRDYRGQTDPYGNELQITQVAVVDELAAAAELVKGKADQVPVAVVRGYAHAVLGDGPGAGGAWTDERGTSEEGRHRLPGHGARASEASAMWHGHGARASEASAMWHGPGVTALIRPADQDLFSLGTAEARAAGLRDAANLADATPFGDATVDASVVSRVLAARAGPAGVSFALDEPTGPDRSAQVVRCVVASAEPDHLVAAGVEVHRLRCALAAEGLATVWTPGDPTDTAGPAGPSDLAGPSDPAGPAPGGLVVGLIAIGTRHGRDHGISATGMR